MDSPYFLILVDFLYIVLFGGLALMRREGLSIRFALEAIGVLAIFLIYGFATGTTPSPVLFLLVVYLVTMRVRLTVDIGIFFARRRNFELAEKIYAFAEHLGPDATNQFIITLNRGVTFIHKGDPDSAIGVFSKVLAKKEEGFLGVKHEAAAHYNLGVAYLKKNLASQASAEFHAVLDTWPTSEYARRAEAALQKSAKEKSGI
jgi:hypothetical protein